MRILVLLGILFLPIAKSVAQQLEMGTPYNINIAELIQALEGGDWKVSYDASCQAAQLLGDLGPAAEKAVPALIRVVEDEENEHAAPVVQHTAAWALGRIGPNARSAIPALEKTFARNDYYLQLQAAVALNAIQPSNPKVVPRLMKLLAYAHPDIRRGAADSLANISPPPLVALPRLRSMVTDSDPKVRQAVLLAITKIQTKVESQTKPSRESSETLKR